MATIIDELLVQLKADNSELLVAMREVATETKKATDTVGKSTEKMANIIEKNTSTSSLAFGSFLGTFASGAALKAFDVLSGAVSGAFHTIVSESIAAAAEGEQATAKLANAFRLMGVDAESGIKPVNDLVDELVKTTTVSDDAAIAVAGTIATIAKLSGPQLTQATQNAVDLSAALGIDLQTAAMAVSKAASGSVESLGRLGIHLKSTGDKSLDAANAMAELEKRFGGSAAAAALTFSGSMQQLQNSFGQFQQALGGVVTTNPVVLTGIKALSDIFADLKKWVDTNSTAINDGLSSALLTAGQFIGGFLVVINEVIRAVEVWINWQTLLAQVVVDTFQAIGKAITGDLKGAAAAFDETRQRASKFMETITGSGELDGLIQGLGGVQNKLEDAFDAKTIKDAENAIGSTNKEAQKTKEILKEASQAAIEFSQALVKKGEDPFASLNFRAEALKQSLAAELVTFQDYYAQRYAQDAEQLILQQKLLEEAHAANQISEEQYQAGLTELSRQHALERNNIEAERTKFEKEQQKQREANIKGSLGIISSLQGAQSQELVAIGKAAATAQAIMDGQVAIQKAWAVGGPFGAVLAAGVAAATAVQIAKIQGVQLAGGIDSVPGKGNQDSVPAMLTPGERVVPVKSNEDLTNFLANQKEGGGGTVNITFTVLGSVLSDGDDLIRRINDTLARGGMRLLNT